MKNKQIHAYDPETLIYVRSYDSVRSAEQDNGIGPKNIAHGFRRGRKTPIGGFFWSYTKSSKYNSKAMEKTNSKQKKSVGISIDEFRQKHDLDFILTQVLENLDPDLVYEKADVIKLTGLRVGYPGLSNALEAASEYMGRAGGVNYWGARETIKKLKDETIMT